MKHIFSYALAFTAVIAAAAGCEKPENGGEGDKPAPSPEESVSLRLHSAPLTRTVLGELSGDTYPVYWCEGDRIAVNGQRSEPLHGVSDKLGDADFTVYGVSAPYGVVYPSWICGKMDSNSAEISLQRVQKWTPDSFSNGSAVLYARSESKEIELKNLCGVVRIGINFAGYKITELVLTSLSDPVSGKFSLNLENGELTVVEGNPSIELSLPEDAFKAEGGSPVELNFCIPEGEYAEGFNITITEKYGRQMVIEMRENTAVRGGVIADWGSQTFKPNGSLIITDPESWNSFAAAVNSGDYSSWQDEETGEVKLAANVTSSEELTQIESWSGVFNGGGYTITSSAFTKPLFKTVAEGATIRNLNLGGLRTAPGANSSATLAAVNLGLIENCENRAALSVSVDKDMHVCGLVEANGGVMRGCVNSADFEINLPYTANHEFICGGIAFQPTSGGKFGTFESCRNSGNITILKDATAESDLQKCAVGGILASAYGGTAESFVVLKDCVNEGRITMWENKFKNAKAQGTYAVGGIVGRIAKMVKDSNGCQYLGFNQPAFYAEITGCSNTGTIDVCSSINSNVSAGMSGARQCYVGGIAGVVVGLADSPAKIENCHNSASILAGGTLKASAIVGGIVGGVGCCTFTSCTNTGSFGTSANTLAPAVGLGSVAGIASHILKLAPVTMKGCSSSAVLPSEATLKGELYATGAKPTVE